MKSVRRACQLVTARHAKRPVCYFVNEIHKDLTALSDLLIGLCLIWTLYK